MSSITHIQLIILHVIAAGRLPSGGFPLTECENIIEGTPSNFGADVAEWSS